MKQELAVTAIIFFLLIVKIAGKSKNVEWLPWIQLLLLLNFISGFFFIQSGTLFADMYHTNGLLAFQKIF
jgi:NADH-quinone oxidoreductase subunit N